MLNIEKNGKATTSVVTCDCCMGGYKWDELVTFSRMESILKKQHGWSFGKKHLCRECKSKGRKQSDE